MSDYAVKYKFSGLLLGVLILIVIVFALFCNFSYLNAKESKIIKASDLKITEPEINALEQIKVMTIDNPLYKQLVPAIEVQTQKLEPSVKANPFANKNQKE